MPTRLISTVSLDFSTSSLETKSRAQAHEGGGLKYAMPASTRSNTNLAMNPCCFLEWMQRRSRTGLAFGTSSIYVDFI